jgi:anaphase-promoting complex subunit 10
VKRICIRCGTSTQDLIDLTAIDLHEPTGWVTIPLFDPIDQLPIRAHLIQVRITAMHQNGRDTHIRQLKIFGPRASPIIMAGLPLSAFKTVEMLQFSQIR